MRQQLVDPQDTTHPALVVTFGNTTKKRRVLKRSITTIGHSPGCDVMINSPDIAAVHSVLVQLGDGLWVRNCATKLNTRVNGNVVQEVRLQDSDILQVGAFVFQIQLPPKPAPSQGPPPGGTLIRSRLSGETQRSHAQETERFPEGAEGETPSKNPSRAIDLVDMAHLKRSRRNLCRLALLMRDRLRKAEQEKEHWLNENRERFEDLEEQEEELQRQAQELDEREESLQRDEHYLDSRAQALEKELAKRRQETDEEIARAWKEHEERCQQASVHCENQVVDAPRSQAVFPEEVEHSLRIRRQELDHFARHLQKQRKTFGGSSASDVGELEHELTILRKENETLRCTDTDLTEGLNKALDAMRNENQTLRRRLQEAPEAAIATMTKQRSTQRTHELEKLRSELMKAEDQLRKKELELRTLREKQVPREDASEQTIATLREHIRALETKLSTSEQEIEKLSMQLDDWNMEVNLEHSGGYERELHRFRVELERDRNDLDEQKRQLELRLAEIDDVSRATELELSRERAMLSRERSELNRMREDIRVERERILRENRDKSRLPGRSLDDIAQME